MIGYPGKTSFRRYRSIFGRPRFPERNYLRNMRSYHYAPQNREHLASLSHSLATIPHNPTGS